MKTRIAHKVRPRHTSLPAGLCTGGA